MKRHADRPAWMPALTAGTPLYLAIADAMAADIATGVLQPGQRLPPHRLLAEALGVDLTTVTRAYGEAQRRGLVEAAVGRGTYVREGAAGATGAMAGPEVDLSMNLPPQPEAAGLAGHLAQTTAAVLRAGAARPLMSYQPAGGSPADRAAGAAWLAPLLPGLPGARVLVSGGAQPALMALLLMHTMPGDTVLTEAFCYPGFRAAAAEARVRLHGLTMDAEGILPDALDEACRRLAPKAFYCGPTLQNPTTATMPPARRAAIADVLRRHAVPLIEDDAYGLLPADPPAPIAALAPQLAWYVATLSKTLLPGLRVAYTVAPDEAGAARLQAALRALSQMAPPLTVAVASRWIQAGTAVAIRQAIAEEARARQALARALLPAGSFAAQPDGHHLWLRLPAPWTAPVFAARLRRHGLAVVSDDAFAVGPAPGDSIRLSLGAARDRDALAAALGRIAATLQGGGEPVAEIV
jgi:DNA-binding transcriptional MocR family regulator